MRKLVLVVLMFVGCVSFGQLISFVNTYGNNGYDYGRDIKQDVDTGYVVTGSSSSFASNQGDAFLLKIDSLGNFKWSVNYGGEGSDWGQSLVITNDSSYAIAGYTNSFGSGGFDFYLVRVDQNGSLLWEKTYGGSDWDRAFGLVQTPDSGFVMAGQTSSFNNGNLSGYVIRTDKWGDTLWTYVEESTTESFFNDIAISGDSIILCGGYYSTSTNSIDGFIKTMTIDGIDGGVKIIGQNEDDYFNCVYVEGGFYNFGGAKSNNFDTEKTNMWNYRMQEDFTEIFDLVYVNYSPKYDQINDLVTRWYNQDTYFVGETESYGYQWDGEEDMVCGKVNSSGVYFATGTFGEAGEDIGQAVDNCYDKGAVFLYDSEYFSNGGNNIVIVKLNYTWVFPDQFNDVIYENITTSFEESEIKGQFYPNPVKDILHFGKYLSGSIRIHDYTGKLVFEKDISTTQINLSSLEKGSYILTYINSKNNEMSKTQIIKD